MEDQQPAIQIPFEAIDEKTLAAVVEEFVLREGTDYGAKEATLASKMEQVLRQIRRGEAKIFYDPASESVTLVNETASFQPKEPTT